MTFEALTRQLLASPAQTLGIGATEAQIDHAARVLGVPIRGGYRLFLMRFGWGGVGSFDIFGVGSGVPKHLDLIRITQSERTEMFPNIPHHLLPILNNGAGDYACLDTRAWADEPPVVMWYHEDGPDQDPQQDALDFVSWLAQMITSCG